MRLTKSLLSVISALALATGAAFAGDRFAGASSSSYSSSYESGGPELLSDADSLSSERYAESDRFSYPMNGSEALALEEGDVLYIYPMETTIVLVPSVDSEMPQG